MTFRPTATLMAGLIAAASSAVAAVSVSPESLVAVGRVDQRFQSYNVESVELARAFFD